MDPAGSRPGPWASATSPKAVAARRRLPEFPVALLANRSCSAWYRVKLPPETGHSSTEPALGLTEPETVAPRLS